MCEWEWTHSSDHLSQLPKSWYLESMFILAIISIEQNIIKNLWAKVRPHLLDPYRCLSTYSTLFLRMTLIDLWKGAFKKTIHSFLWLSSIPLYVCVYMYIYIHILYLLYPFICWLTFILFPCFGYYESYFYEYRGACIFL